MIDRNQEERHKVKVKVRVQGLQGVSRLYFKDLLMSSDRGKPCASFG